jgi:carbamoyl-phosphate synthase small subunit
MKALLTLEDGWHAWCESFTGPGEAIGELVFNTGLTGYQEVITDPSYRGQIVLMTSSMIGNYGIRVREDESAQVHTAGFVVREYGGEPFEPERARTVKTGGHPTFHPDEVGEGPESAHNKVQHSLADYLAGQGVPGVEGVDTRELTRRIREQGAMNAGITTGTLDPEKFLQKVKAAPSMEGLDLVGEVTPKEPYLYHEADGPRIGVIDCGVKISSLRALASRGCRVEVFPANSDKNDVLKTKPDGILVSNGPGDPAALPWVVNLVDGLIGKAPVFGICLGHQIIGQVLGGKTFKLKFGHHGGNHPVRDERTGKVFITTQNHGFNVDRDTLDMKQIEPTFVNLNDHTLEGLKHRKLPLFSVQFHPEAGPGPHDTRFLFDEFLGLVHA